jgi:hypothetical protein
MATLASYISELPLLFQKRYDTSGLFVTWTNQLLSRLGMRGILPSIVKETGVLIENEVWINKPSDFFSLVEIYSPDNSNMLYRAEEVNSKLKLLDVCFDDPDPDYQYTSSTLTSYTTTGLTADIAGVTDDFVEDEFDNWLMVVTAGTYTNNSYVLSGNDASSTGTTKLYFLHALEAALSGTTASAISLTGPSYYVMLRYLSKLTSVSSNSDEVTIDNNYETEIVPAWLRFKCEQHTSSVSKETGYWEAETEKLLSIIEGAKNSRPIRPTRGRRLPGFEKSHSSKKSMPDYSEFQ